MTSIADVLEGRARWCVVEGENAPVLAAMADKSVDHVITDPPYSEHVHAKSATRHVVKSGGGYAPRNKINVARDLGFDFMDPEHQALCGREFGRLARRWTLVFCDVELSASWRESVAADYVRTGAWIKLGATPQFSGDRPAAGYETIVIHHAPGAKRWNGGGGQAVWTCPIVKPQTGERWHTTPKPPDLMRALVSDFTDPDDLILDPFAGSGTTGVAALRLGRRCVLIERDPAYAAICRERLTAEENGSTLRASRAGQVPMFGGDK